MILYLKAAATSQIYFPLKLIYRSLYRDIAVQRRRHKSRSIRRDMAIDQPRLTSKTQQDQTTKRRRSIGAREAFAHARFARIKYRINCVKRRAIPVLWIRTNRLCNCLRNISSLNIQTNLSKLNVHESLFENIERCFVKDESFSLQLIKYRL